MVTNPCVRCGKERIKGKEKTVILNATSTKITVYVCPDKECQKIVDKQIAEREEKRMAFENRRPQNKKAQQKPS